MPTWTDPELVIATYGLLPIRQEAERLVHELFGPDASIRDEIEVDPESKRASLVFSVVIGIEQQGLRGAFLDRYAAEIIPPADAPIPAILWEYRDAVPA